jgi:hypothetical protein
LSDQWKGSIIVQMYMNSNKTDSNYCGISLLSTSYKIVFNILPLSLRDIDKVIGVHQCGFRCNRSDQIFPIRHIQEKKCEYNESVYQAD